MTDYARHYFVYGNTAQGFISKLQSNLQGIEQLFIIRGRPGTGKAGFMNIAAALCEKSGLVLEYLHCPSAPDLYDGIIIPALKLAIVDGTDLHDTQLRSADSTVRFIDTDTVFDSIQLTQSADKIAEILHNIGNFHENAFHSFADALHVHDEWEKIYIENMDFSEADSLTTDVIDMILGAHHLNKAPVSKERFFGASTPKGAMDYIENLTGNLSKRYLLKGRPGTGKSTLLRKLAAASNDRGLDTEIYSCAFDSTSLDMIIWPELDVCLFDSTAPHLYEPSMPNDAVIDMYTACVKPGTDEKYEAVLEDIINRYRKAIQSGTEYLSEAKGYMDELINFYSGIADSGKIYSMCHEIAGQVHF